ncbi:MAG: hypothetical protein ACREA3_08380, partial [Nitrosotalea sp.]
HKQYVMDSMNKNGIDQQFYNIMLVPPESVERLSNVQNNSVTHLTPEESEVYNVLKDGGTASWIAEKTRFSSYDVMGILWKLEQKGITERGYAETKKTEHDPVSGKKITETKRQEYFIPTEEGKKLADKDEPVPLLPWHGIDIEIITTKPQDFHPKHDMQTQNNKSEIKGEQVSQIPNLSDGIDFSKLTNEQLKAFVTIPQFSHFAKQILENRGYFVSIKEGKARLRKRY